ncbi:outer membrane beta-barrel protein [Flavobacterium sp. RSSB_23]|uniref:outer membrane beta-barrel protein n=1 Tax=Flavobacterium sp. RSSB_23 TaxID=3447668 RepID=UPI003F3F8566
MIKKIFSLFLFLIYFNASSQEISFGPVIGANFYDIEIVGPIIGGAGGSYFNFGGFMDYKLNERFGLKSQIIYANSQENEHSNFEPYNTGIIFESSKIKNLHLHLLGKFDVRGAYNKGFYLVGGFRITKVLDAKSGLNQDLEYFYKKTNLGLSVGFGTVFLKNFSAEFVGDYSLTKTIAIPDNKSKNFGFYFNLSYNLAPLTIKK